MATLHIVPPDHSPASFFKFKREPEMTNDSCNVLSDTNHFWLLGTLDNLEHAESRREGEVLENEQLQLLADKNPQLARQQQCVLIDKQIASLERGESVGDWPEWAVSHSHDTLGNLQRVSDASKKTDIHMCRAHGLWDTSACDVLPKTWVLIAIFLLERRKESLREFQQLCHRTQHVLLDRKLELCRALQSYHPTLRGTSKV